MGEMTLGGLRTSAESRAGERAGAAVRDAAIVGVAALVVALLIGMSYGVQNQNTYLLAPLRHLDPTFLRSDWLAAHTYAYHPAFTWVITALAALGPLPLMTTALNASMLVVFALIVWRLVAAIAPADARTAALLVLLLVLVDRTLSVGQSYIFDSYLQPSVLASVAFVAAMAAFVRGRWMWSGVWVAAAGVLHANYLVVGLLAFGAAQLFLGRQGLLQRWAWQLVPGIVVLVVDLPVMLRMGAGGAAAQQALYIFQVIRSPHHYVVRHFLAEIIPFVGWQLAAPLALRRAAVSRIEWRRLVALDVALAGPVLVATAAGLVVISSRLTQLYLWRLAPFAVLLVEIVAAIAVSRALRGERPEDADAARAESPAMVIAAVVGGVMVVGYAITSARGGVDLLAPALALLLVAAAIVVLLWRGVRSAQVVPVAFALVAAAASVNVGARWNILAPDGTPAERDLFRWAMTTPTDAVFLVPPAMDPFRLRAARAIVVDWKSTPILPTELLEWYRRISDEAGGHVTSLGAAERGYAAMSATRALQLASRYDARFVVFRNVAAPPDRDSLAVAYRNARYTVYDLHAKGIAAAR